MHVTKGELTEGNEEGVWTGAWTDLGVIKGDRVNPKGKGRGGEGESTCDNCGGWGDMSRGTARRKGWAREETRGVQKGQTHLGEKGAWLRATARVVEKSRERCG